jgi:thioredoxin reductase (NADPH)
MLTKRPLPKKTHTIIIGAGPAGMAAALQLQRYNIDFQIFDVPTTNSLLKNAECVANYLGIKKTLSGLKLLQLFQQHIAQNNIAIVPQKVMQLSFDSATKYFIVQTPQNIYQSSHIITASGTVAKKLPLFDKQSSTVQLKLFYEVAPLLNKRNKNILIIGAGDAAFDYALNLSKHNKITLINRSNTSKALPILIKNVLANININYVENCAILKIANNKSKSLRCFIKTGIEKTFCKDFDYLLAAIGRVPQKTFYAEALLKNETKLLKTGNLLLAGDVKNAIYRQTALAVADGIYAAMKLHKN